MSKTIPIKQLVLISGDDIVTSLDCRNSNGVYEVVGQEYVYMSNQGGMLPGDTLFQVGGNGQDGCG